MIDFKSRISAFGQNESGTIAVIFALSVMILIGTTGLAVDASRAYSVSMRVGSILDAAALAGAKMFDRPNSTDADIRARTQAFLKAHTNALNVTGLSLTNFQTAIDRSKSSVKLTIDVKVPTTFANVAGIPSFDFTKSAKVVYDLKRVELAMVLDVTGSMALNGKLDAMKVAAKEVIDLLIDPSAPPALANKIALAPYAASVNVGGYLGSVASGQSVTGDTCVLERPGTASQTDQAPGGAARARVMNTLNPAGDPNYHYSCPAPAIMPLSTSLGALKSHIDAFTGFGGTAGHMGTAWGFHLISPNWAGVFGGASAPGSYTDPQIVKAVLIMTDGLFNTAYKSSNASADTVQIDESYAEFAALCSNMKAQKIQVFTVAFSLALELEPGQTRARNALRGCASEPGQFFEAENNSGLLSAFRSIADQLTSLKISG
jgi:Flp pilus assembly protein TadG